MIQWKFPSEGESEETDGKAALDELLFAGAVSKGMAGESTPEKSKKEKTKYGPGYDKSADLIRAQKRVLHLLERSPKSEKQIRDKLIEGEYQPAVIDQAVAYAKSFGYIDDKKFAADYVRINCGKKSRARLTADLSQKGVDREIIQLAIEEEYQVDEISIIRDLLKKRGYFDVDASDYEAARKNREKNFRFLSSRGYSSSSIIKAMEMDEQF